MKYILIVDDDAALRQSVRDVLDLLAPSLVILEAANGQACLDLVQQQTPDVIFLDAQMPVMDGYETAKQLQQLPERNSFILIGMSGQRSRLAKVAEMWALCDAHLVKPFTIDQLADVLAQFGI